MQKKLIWDNVFKNEPSKSCGRQSLKNFTRPILEYFVPYIIRIEVELCERVSDF